MRAYKDKENVYINDNENVYIIDIIYMCVCVSTLNT